MQGLQGNPKLLSDLRALEFHAIHPAAQIGLREFGSIGHEKNLPKKEKKAIKKIYTLPFR
jgi:hypothetical protein